MVDSSSFDRLLQAEYLGLVKNAMSDYNRTAFGFPLNPGEVQRRQAACVAIGGHFWGPIERSSGVCWNCEGEGIVFGDETNGGLWPECNCCNGLGYTPTRYSQYCDGCGFGRYSKYRYDV